LLPLLLLLPLVLVGGVVLVELLPLPQPIPAVTIATKIKLSKACHLRRRPGSPRSRTPAKAAPPLARNHPEPLCGRSAALLEEAVMVRVVEMFPFTVTEAGLSAHVRPEGAVQVRATAELKPLTAPKLSVSVALLPCITVTIGVCATMVKSESGLVTVTVAEEGW
jgi:hypothetical protein